MKDSLLLSLLPHSCSQGSGSPSGGGEQWQKQTVAATRIDGMCLCTIGPLAHALLAHLLESTN